MNRRDFASLIGGVIGLGIVGIGFDRLDDEPDQGRVQSGSDDYPNDESRSTQVEHERVDTVIEDEQAWSYSLEPDYAELWFRVISADGEPVTVSVYDGTRFEKEESGEAENSEPVEQGKGKMVYERIISSSDLPSDTESVHVLVEPDMSKPTSIEFEAELYY